MPACILRPVNGHGQRWVQNGTDQCDMYVEITKLAYPEYRRNNSSLMYFYKIRNALVPSNGVRLMCGVRLMVTKTNHFNTEFVLKTPPTVVYISFHVYLTRDTTSNVMSVHYLVNSC